MSEIMARYAHVPHEELYHSLMAGEPDDVRQVAAAWASIGDGLRQIGAALTQDLDRVMGTWTGDAAEMFHRRVGVIGPFSEALAGDCDRSRSGMEQMADALASAKTRAERPEDPPSMWETLLRTGTETVVASPLGPLGMVVGPLYGQVMQKDEREKAQQRTAALVAEVATAYEDTRHGAWSPVTAAPTELPQKEFIDPGEIHHGLDLSSTIDAIMRHGAATAAGGAGVAAARATTAAPTQATAHHDGPAPSGTALAGAGDSIGAAVAGVIGAGALGGQVAAALPSGGVPGGVAGPPTAAAAGMRSGSTRPGLTVAGGPAGSAAPGSTTSASAAGPRSGTATTTSGGSGGNAAKSATSGRTAGGTQSGQGSSAAQGAQGSRGGGGSAASSGSGQAGHSGGTSARRRRDRRHDEQTRWLTEDYLIWGNDPESDPPVIDGSDRR
jgi:uncharacterized protein YukE